MIVNIKKHIEWIEECLSNDTNGVTFKYVELSEHHITCEINVTNYFKTWS